MDLRVLEYFMTVIAEGNVSKAAIKLHLTQPTLTRQLQQLEELYGSQLFLRGSRHITLTESGIILKKRAQELLDLQAKTKLEIEKSEQDISGLITIGCGELNGIQILPELLKVFSKRYPQVKYKIVTIGSVENKEKIREGLVDIAIVLEPIDQHTYQSLRLPYSDYWCLLMKKDDKLAKRKLICQEDIVDLPIALPYNQNVQRRFKEWLGQEFDSQVILNFDLNSSLCLLVDKGFCYGITIDGAVASQYNNSLVYRPLQPKVLSQSYLIWKNGPITSRPLQKFIECAQELYE